MSRRKQTLPPIPIEGVGKSEYGLRNYMNINDIYRGNRDMQTIIINSFYNQFELGDNDDMWRIKIDRVHARFAKFCGYAHTWKTKIAPQSQDAI